MLNDTYVATSQTSLPAGGTGTVTLTLTGVPWPIYSGEGINAYLDLFSASGSTDHGTILTAGTWSAANGGTQTITMTPALRLAHTAPFAVGLHGNNNGVIFDHVASQSNAGWGFNVQDDHGADQNDLRFDKVYATYNGGGGLHVTGNNSNGTIQGGTFPKQ